jgi:calmodulin
MPASDFRFLMNNKPELTEQDLRDLLLDNEVVKLSLEALFPQIFIFSNHAQVVNFDPVAEAFKCYDPQGTGFVDLETLRAMFSNLGFGEITDDDLLMLLETGDGDGDGRISLSDFRTMVSVNTADKRFVGSEEINLNAPNGS